MKKAFRFAVLATMFVVGVCWYCSSRCAAQDMTIIPKKLVWKVDSIDEVWTVKVNQQDLEETAKMYYSLADRTVILEKNKGTSLESEHNLDTGIGAEANGKVDGNRTVDVKSGIGTNDPDGGFNLLMENRLDMEGHANAHGYFDYKYHRNRKYWENEDQRDTTTNKEGNLETAQQVKKVQVNKSNQRLRARITFANFSGNSLFFNKEHFVDFCIGDDQLGDAHPTVKETILASTGKPKQRIFEMELDDTDRIRDFADNGANGDLYVDFDVFVLQNQKQKDANGIDGVIQESESPFRVTVITPGSFREWDIRQDKNNPLSLQAIFDWMDEKCQEISQFPIQLKKQGDTVVSMHGVAFKPQANAKMYLIVKHGNEFVTDLNKITALFQSVPMEKDSFTFYFLRGDMVRSLVINQSERSMLQECGDVLTLWKKQKAIQPKFLELNLIQDEAEWIRGLETKAGNEEAAQYKLFHYYYDKKDAENAAKWLCKIAERNNAPVNYRFLLGRWYFDGTGLEANRETGLKWMRKVAEQKAEEADKETNDLINKAKADIFWCEAQKLREEKKLEEAAQKIYSVLNEYPKDDNYNKEKRAIADDFWREAQKLREETKWDDAAKKIDQALGMYPENENYKAEKQMLGEARRRAFAEDLYHEAQKLRGEKKLEEAVKKIDTAVTMYPSIENYKKERQMIASLVFSSENRKAGDRAVMMVDGIEYTFRWCPPGTFMMGSPSNEGERDEDEFQHAVILTKGFWMLETEVTQAMWQNVMGYNPSGYSGDNRPVERVPWGSCMTFCSKLSEKIGMKITLPTEAQWEYACRAGTTGPYACNLDQMAWYGHAFVGTTHAVRQTKPNAWGLFDMHGNVWEWCQDWKGYYPRGPITDPMGPDSGETRVCRGGGYGSGTKHCRSAYRYSYEVNTYYDYLGFRVVCLEDDK